MNEPRVVTVGSPPAFRQQVARILETDPEDVGWLASVTAVEESILEGHEWADVVVLSPGVKDPDAIGLAEFVARTSPTTAIVLTRDRPPNGVVIPAMRAGIRDVVDMSRGSQELREALIRAVSWSASLRLSRSDHQPKGQTRRGALITVFSSKGGAGKTFLSCNLAAAISQITKKNTAIVDLDLGMGDVFTYYGSEPGRPIQDLAALGDAMDREIILGSGTQLNDHLWGYGSLPDPAPTPIAGGEAGKVLRAMRSTFPYTIVDSPADFSDHILAAFDMSDTICLITGLDVVGIRHLSRAMETLLAIGLPRERFRVILNWADSKVGLEPAEVERVMRLSVDAMIPASHLVPLSLNRGKPVYFEEPKSDVARAIRGIAESLTTAVVSVDTTPDGYVERRGLFRRR